MKERYIIRQIDDRIFILELSPDQIEASITIQQYTDSDVAKARAAAFYGENQTTKVSDYFIINSPINRLGITTAHLRSCGLQSWGTPTGQLIVHKDITSSALLPCISETIDMEVVNDDHALDDLHLYYKRA